MCSDYGFPLRHHLSDPLHVSNHQKPHSSLLFLITKQTQILKL